jgi:hypothetical protein
MIYDGWFPKDADDIKCPACKVGYAERVRCTPEEFKEYNCKRRYESCARTFVCAACGYRRPRRGSIKTDMDYQMTEHHAIRCD